jgi:hypothetical protein
VRHFVTWARRYVIPGECDHGLGGRLIDAILADRDRSSTRTQKSPAGDKAARKAPNLAERDHLTRQAARLNARGRH